MEANGVTARGTGQFETASRPKLPWKARQIHKSPPKGVDRRGGLVGGPRPYRFRQCQNRVNSEVRLS
jgi:hypothetical protein